VDSAHQLHRLLEENGARAEMLRLFFFHLTVCHSVIPQPGTGVDVMITFSAIFDNFRRKNWRFSKKPMLR
jgi:hypothetical protein